MTISLKEFQRYCLEQSIPFVSYIMPGDKSPVTLWSEGRGVDAYKAVTDIQSGRGFIIAPFQSETCPVIVISDDFIQNGWDLNISCLPQYLASHGISTGMRDLNIVTYDEYIAGIEDIKRTLTTSKAGKVVISRVKLLEDVEPRLLPEIFEELAGNYSHAFVYLLYTPQSGIWIGASPESLVRINQNEFSTMALAGTKAFSESDFNSGWTDKEIKEQEYVVNHVRQRLHKGGYIFNESERQTVSAGNVQHLRTMFSGRLINGPDEWKKLVELLYPTPAICGTDSETTLQVIQQAEKHKREYYTGIIGPFETGGQTNLFINLRCMKVVGQSALLFAGGGILGESSAVKEWEETELKFNTLSQIIRNITVKADKS